jgi:phospholipid/cholesterol/gamma-HCH transport system permease protein
MMLSNMVRKKLQIKTASEAFTTASVVARPTPTAPSRALAMMLSMPLLVAECIAVGIAAGYFVAIFMLDINGTYYMANMVRWTRNRDIIMGLSKAFCFGILIVFISCQKGLTAREGAVGVGRATTEAVVNASLSVLVCNFFLTMLFNIIYPAGYQ